VRAGGFKTARSAAFTAVADRATWETCPDSALRRAGCPRWLSTARVRGVLAVRCTVRAWAGTGRYGLGQRYGARYGVRARFTRRYARGCARGYAALRARVLLACGAEVGGTTGGARSVVGVCASALRCAALRLCCTVLVSVSTSGCSHARDSCRDSVTRACTLTGRLNPWGLCYRI
jgi:hypothetical protein